MFLSRYSIAEHLNEHALDLGIAAEFIQENGGGGGEIERGRGFRLCAGKRLPYGWNVTQPHVNVYQREGWNIFATAAAVLQFMQQAVGIIPAPGTCVCQSYQTHVDWRTRGRDDFLQCFNSLVVSAEKAQRQPLGPIRE